MTREELLKMDLHHEVVIFDSRMETQKVMRVYEGWIYTKTYFESESVRPEQVAMCFVPEVTNVEANVTNHY